MRKPQRWYTVEKGELYVYNSPNPNTATSVSVVPISDKPYYRNNFDLQKVWANGRHN